MYLNEIWTEEHVNFIHNLTVEQLKKVTKEVK